MEQLHDGLGLGERRISVLREGTLDSKDSEGQQGQGQGADYGAAPSPQSSLSVSDGEERDGVERRTNGAIVEEEDGEEEQGDSQ